MRKPWVAVVLSLLCPGLGHLYAGFPWRGLVLLLLPFGVLAGFVLLSTATPSAALLGVLVGAVFALPVVYLFAVLDAHRLAKAAPADFRLRWWQHPAVYALLFVLSFFSMPISTLFLRAEVIEAFVIPAQSMAPTILPRDRVLVTKWGWTGADAKKGDIVVFRLRLEGREVNYIKRVAALPGEVVTEGTGKALTVPEGHLWMLGDNAEMSRDSRTFGPIPTHSVLGPARYRYWPPSRFGTLE